MNQWEKAIDLDIHLISDYPECTTITEKLYKEISSKLRVRNEARSKETLKLIIINLWLSYKDDSPVKYSRNRNDYLSPKRYGKLHIKYKRLIPIIDTLVDLGYIEQKTGFFDSKKQFGRQSRMKPTAKLISLFEEYLLNEPGIIYKTQPSEIVQLKDDNKDLIDYVDTRSIRNMRVNLRRYNEFIEKQDVEVFAPSHIEVNARFLLRLRLSLLKGLVGFKDMYIVDQSEENRNEEERCQVLDDEIFQVLFPALYYTVSGTSGVCKDMIVISDEHTLHNHTHPISLNILNTIHHSISHPSFLTSNHHNSNFLIYTYTMTKTLREIKDKNTRKTELLKKRPFADFGLNGLRFQCRYQYLHRVFNNESFKLGGRFYGALHLELPKELRSYIRINGEQSRELDYSGLHIRMLYNLEGIDYCEDPYTAICDDEKERKFYKLSLLIALNSKSEAKAVKAIRDELRDEHLDFDLTDRFIFRCLEKFKRVHSPIAKYLNTGIGLKLQNIDSKITDRILRTMTENQIPCLPVHDSYIVPRRDEIFLREVMDQVYEQDMGFKPIIK